MYKNFFGLRSNPFSVNPDPRFLYLTQHAKEALACLTFGIQCRKGFIVLTGEVGTGKTTLLNKMQVWLQQKNMKTAFIFNPRLEVEQFLEFMMNDFGIPGASSNTKSQLLMRLNNWLLERYRAGETAVLIVDEAQNLSSEMLEEIRLLTNLETSTEKLLQIVLAGQPELDAKLQQPELRQLKQRVTLRSRTYSLTLGETRDYVNQRLHIAGSTGPAIFTPEAVEAVHLYSNGIPRVINLICEHALITAFAEQQRLIGPEIINAVAEDFELTKRFNAAPSSHMPEESQADLLGALNAMEKLTRRLHDLETAMAEKKGAPAQ
jgi:general secretion pathway protein A